ncbi:PREDICTED: uncharacterized protein LOC106124161 [Papilio xuthus]|uniref:Uncharacterized protein LOC106124161 n=1 Tax=Papilio xuthus TaxID=66420 RepID=A0AAJ6ZN44_PAPXU|nr:PREDICTED: uncharacterized protein LOC106124161 [Papilio xuthus]
MSHCCSQCDFTAKFESALMMHRQLHHNCAAEEFPTLDKLKNKTSSLPLMKKKERSFSPCSEGKALKGPSRTSSATRLFDKLRTRICRSKTLFVHQEEGAESVVTEPSPRNHRSTNLLKDHALSECTTRTILHDGRPEKYSCHLCSFDADRITVLDRHLLNHHKIGLENLLKLVMSKTKDGLSDDASIIDEYGMRQPYYKQADNIIEEGEFIIETVTPKIKILKHAAVNTDLKWNDIPELKNNYRMIKKELERLIDSPIEDNQKDKLLLKMQSLNECMCKFVDSSNTLKKVLTKNILKNEHTSGPVFSLGLGDQETPREWERPHSEKLERNKCKHDIRGEKKCSTESFYF